MSAQIHWIADAEEHDYPAAESYLSLLYPQKNVAQTVKALRETDVVKFKAKDIFRAAQLPLLGRDNYHVKKDVKKIKKGRDLSPLLLVRDDKSTHLIIADGYHRLCAIYSFDEDAWVPCKIV